MSSGRSAGAVLVGLGCVAGGILAIFVLLRVLDLAGQPGLAMYHIPSGAMTPTILVGDQIAAIGNIYVGGPVPRGQVVVFKNPSNRTIDYIMRVIGLPGDRVQLRAGRLYIDDLLVDRKPATDAPPATQDKTMRPLQFYREFLPGGRSHLIGEESDDQTVDNTDLFVVPPDHVFVMGDNRDNSADSRTFGFVPVDLLRDKPLFIYWSTGLSRIGVAIE